MAELIEIPFWILSLVDPRNHVFRRGYNLPWEEAILRRKGMPRHARQHSDVNCTKWLNRSICRLGCGVWTQIGWKYKFKSYSPGSGKHDWTVRLRQWCGLMSNYC